MAGWRPTPHGPVRAARRASRARHGVRPRPETTGWAPERRPPLLADIRSSRVKNMERHTPARVRHRGLPHGMASVAAVPSGKTSSVAGWTDPPRAALDRHAGRAVLATACQQRPGTMGWTPRRRPPPLAGIRQQPGSKGWAPHGSSRRCPPLPGVRPEAGSTGWTPRRRPPRYRAEPQQRRPRSTGGSPSGIRHDRPFDHGQGKTGWTPERNPPLPRPRSTARLGGVDSRSASTLPAGHSPSSQSTHSQCSRTKA